MTDKEAAFEALSSGTSHERLIAARKLVRLAEKRDLNRLRQLHVVEVDGWVRAALQDAISCAAGGIDLSRPVSPDPQNEADEAISEALEQAARVILHEVRGIVGRLRAYASQEVPEYERSKTASELRQLQTVIRGIEQLSAASGEAHFDAFDLQALVDEVSEREKHRSDIDILLAGDTPCTVIGDRSLLDIIIANSIRNAIEATPAREEQRSEIIVNWGENKHEFWIVVLDRGRGLPLELEEIFKTGRTTKASHFGIGLTVVDRAAKTLGGSVHLVNRNDGGTKFECRWPNIKHKEYK